MSKVKIGILECDSVIKNLQNDFKDYPGMFIESFNNLGADFEYNIYNVTKNNFPVDIDECDAYITTGSRASANDDDTWIAELEEFIRSCNRHEKKLVGVCFGHQLLAKALGGIVERSHSGWGIGLIENRVLRRKPWMEPSLTQFNMIICHEDQVIRIPEGTELLVSNVHCTNFIFQCGEKLLGIQGHPEFSKDFCRALMKERNDIIPKDSLKAGYSSLSDNPNNQILMQWIINFMKQDTVDSN